MVRLTILLEAVEYAAHVHAGQTRKGAAKEPYVTHVVDVARRVATVAPEDEVLLLAALLHDAVEDTEATREAVAGRFGEEVAALVMEVTDDKSLPKQERKRLQVVEAPGKSRRAKLIKLADKTSNLTALADSPPPDWPAERLRSYLDWAEEVVAGLRGTESRLEAEFARAADRVRGILG